ncbi:hypothetical protein KSP39_PZI020603 [Platanthera zijinensis]|uniref:Uncharacterized protein n=1 Tax=Platanthera zijinensis TaxID=2320716 RepID=A0AAP0AZZ2_9ASPA
MSFSIHSPDVHIWENAAFDAAVDSAGAKTWLPLQPISVNLSKFPKLNPRKENQNPVAPAKPSKRSRIPAARPTVVREDDIEADIEEIEKEIRRLSERLVALRAKKAEKDLRAAASQPFATAKKDLRPPEKVGNTGKRRRTSLIPKSQNPSIANALERRKGVSVSTAGVKKPVKKEDSMSGRRLRPSAAVRERGNPAIAKRPATNHEAGVATSRYGLRSREPERKRRKWSLPENGGNNRKSILFLQESKGWVAQ